MKWEERDLDSAENGEHVRGLHKTKRKRKKLVYLRKIGIIVKKCIYDDKMLKK